MNPLLLIVSFALIMVGIDGSSKSSFVPANADYLFAYVCTFAAPVISCILAVYMKNVPKQISDSLLHSLQVKAIQTVKPYL
jgi:hypothetical protein